MAETPPEQWPARLRALVYEQFKASNWAIPLANIVGKQRGDLAGLYIALLSLWSIDTVTDDATSPAYGIGRGVQLDRIGRLVGQARGAASDDEYRPVLRARVVANKSNGGGDSAIEVFLAMFNGAASILLTPGWRAEFTLRVGGAVFDPLLVPAALGLLASATQAGTRSVLEWRSSNIGHTLICDSTSPNQCVGDETRPSLGGACAGAAAAT